MNKDYNKHLSIVIAILSAITIALYACSRKDDIREPRESNTEFDICGIDSAYVEDSLHEEYDEVKVDKQGNVYHVNCK